MKIYTSNRNELNGKIITDKINTYDFPTSADYNRHSCITSAVGLIILIGVIVFALKWLVF